MCSSLDYYNYYRHMYTDSGCIDRYNNIIWRYNNYTSGSTVIETGVLSW